QFHFPLPSPVLLPRVESIPPAIQSAHIHDQLACHHAHLLAGSDSLHRRSPELFSVFPRSSVVLVHCSSFLLQCDTFSLSQFWGAGQISVVARKITDFTTQ